MDCMQVAGRVPEKLTLISKGIQHVLKEVKDLNDSTNEGKMRELESFIGSSAPDQIDILPSKQCNTKEVANELRVERRKQ